MLLQCVYICIFCSFCNQVNAGDSSSQNIISPFHNAFEEQKISVEPVRSTQDNQSKQKSSNKTFELRSQLPQFHKTEQSTDKTTTNDVPPQKNTVSSKENQNTEEQIFLPTEYIVNFVSLICWWLAGLSVLTIIVLKCLKLLNLWKQHLSSTSIICEIKNNIHEKDQKIRICPRCGWKCSNEATECINPKCRTRF